MLRFLRDGAGGSFALYEARLLHASCIALFLKTRHCGEKYREDFFHVPKLAEREGTTTPRFALRAQRGLRRLKFSPLELIAPILS